MITLRNRIVELERSVLGTKRKRTGLGAEFMEHIDDLYDLYDPKLCDRVDKLGTKLAKMQRDINLLMDHFKVEVVTVKEHTIIQKKK